jgi:hypothetical protein
MNIRAIPIWFAAAVACLANAANTPPVSGSWNIASSGRATSSGELLFRVTPGDGGDVSEVTVFVLSGTNDTGVASNIRRALNSQLRADRFDVESGENANVVLTNGGRGNGFSIELIDSDVENVRVVVQSVAPVVPPTVPEQAIPANPPQGAPATPPAPGDVVPPATDQTPAKSPAPNSDSLPVPAPPNATSPSLPNPSPAPAATPGGVPANAPSPDAQPAPEGM